MPLPDPSLPLPSLPLLLLPADRWLLLMLPLLLALLEAWSLLPTLLVGPHKKFSLGCRPSEPGSEPRSSDEALLEVWPLLPLPLRPLLLLLWLMHPLLTKLLPPLPLLSPAAIAAAALLLRLATSEAAVVTEAWSEAPVVEVDAARLVAAEEEAATDACDTAERDGENGGWRLLLLLLPGRRPDDEPLVLRAS